jgi:hypothetical protein
VTHYVIGVHHEPTDQRYVKLKLATDRVVCDTVELLKYCGYWKMGLAWRYVTEAELEPLKAGKKIPAWQP